jgi:hypothetical protein
MGSGDDVDYDDVFNELNEEEARDDHYESSPEALQYVRNMTMQYFRKKLVAHFDILWSQHRLVNSDYNTLQSSILLGSTRQSL